MFESKQWQSATDFFMSAFTELAVLFVVISFLVSLINHYFQTVHDYSSQNSGCGTNSCGLTCGQQKATTYISREYSVPAILLDASFKELSRDGVEVKWDHSGCMILGKNLANVCLDKLKW